MPISGVWREARIERKCCANVVRFSHLSAHKLSFLSCFSPTPYRRSLSQSLSHSFEIATGASRSATLFCTQFPLSLKQKFQKRRRKRTAAISENLQTERKFVHLTEPVTLNPLRLITVCFSINFGA